MIELNGKYTNADIMIDEVEEECIGQITKMINHEAFTNKICIMPDTHAGKGSVIGFTMKKTDRIIPNICGSDIGCGMLSINIGKSDLVNLNLEKLDTQIRELIPFGTNIHNNKTIFFEFNEINNISKKCGINKVYNEEWFNNKCEQINSSYDRVLNSLGTLGGGNHFIEFGKDDVDNIWFTIHSGSRKLGKDICEYWQNKATNKYSDIENSKIDEKKKEIISKIKTSKNKTEKRNLQLKLNSFKNGTSTKNPLDYLEGDLANEYIEDMLFAQYYASVNRKQMAISIENILLKDYKFVIKDTIECVHNYIDFGDNIIRKGAIRSYVGERMIIPFNMRDGILICEGKSNPKWNFSAPHGAGRVLSRSGAKKTLDLNEFKKQMDGIYSTSVCNSTLDEAPNAYKDSSIIENAIGPTAKILFKIKPIMNLKSI